MEREREGGARGRGRERGRGVGIYKVDGRGKERRVYGLVSINSDSMDCVRSMKR